MHNYMTLEELIEQLRVFHDPYKYISRLTNPHSYRGYYDDLAFVPKNGCMTVQDLYDMCQESLGKEFDGWKGGEYIMGRKTPVWISREGYGSGLALAYLTTGGDFITYDVDGGSFRPLTPDLICEVNDE